MKKLNLSGFDLGVIIAFAVVTIIGAVGWWYLSSGLQAAQDDVHTAYSDFNNFSTKSGIVVSPSNGATLKSNIDLLKAQLDPLIQTKLQPRDSKLLAITREDPVAWKHDLDDEVTRLKGAAKSHNVDVQPDFYFGFARYRNQSPSDEQTAVLSKQLLAIDQLTTVLIDAPVKNIQAIRRTYEEDPPLGGGIPNPTSTSDPDRALGYSVSGARNNYTAYPFEFDFVTTAENFRPVMNNLLQSSSVFVVRSVTVTSSSVDSPTIDVLDKLAGTPPPPMTGSSPGEVAATTSTSGPQFLFGNETITVKLRVDMIDWTAKASE